MLYIIDEFRVWVFRALGFRTFTVQGLGFKLLIRKA